MGIFSQQITNYKIKNCFENTGKNNICFEKIINNKLINKMNHI